MLPGAGPAPGGPERDARAAACRGWWTRWSAPRPAGGSRGSGGGTIWPSAGQSVWLTPNALEAAWLLGPRAARGRGRGAPRGRAAGGARLRGRGGEGRPPRRAHGGRRPRVEGEGPPLPIAPPPRGPEHRGTGCRFASALATEPRRCGAGGTSSAERSGRLLSAGRLRASASDTRVCETSAHDPAPTLVCRAAARRFALGSPASEEPVPGDEVPRVAAGSRSGRFELLGREARVRHRATPECRGDPRRKPEVPRTGSPRDRLSVRAPPGLRRSPCRSPRETRSGARRRSPRPQLPRARLSNRVNSERNTRSMVPVGPFRCLATMSSTGVAPRPPS